MLLWEDCLKTWSRLCGSLVMVRDLSLTRLIREHFLDVKVVWPCCWMVSDSHTLVCPIFSTIDYVFFLPNTSTTVVCTMIFISSTTCRFASTSAFTGSSRPRVPSLLLLTWLAQASCRIRSFIAFNQTARADSQVFRGAGHMWVLYSLTLILEWACAFIEVRCNDLVMSEDLGSDSFPLPKVLWLLIVYMRALWPLRDLLPSTSLWRCVRATSMVITRVLSLFSTLMSSTWMNTTFSCTVLRAWSTLSWSWFISIVYATRPRRMSASLNHANLGTILWWILGEWQRMLWILSVQR